MNIDFVGFLAWCKHLAHEDNSMHGFWHECIIKLNPNNVACVYGVVGVDYDADHEDEIDAFETLYTQYLES